MTHFFEGMLRWNYLTVICEKCAKLGFRGQRYASLDALGNHEDSTVAGGDQLCFFIRKKHPSALLRTCVLER